MSTPDNPPAATVPLDSRSREQSDALSATPNDAPPSVPADSMDVSPAPETAYPLDTPQSQPMTATASSSSLHPLLENGDGGAFSSYGTRSRNRTGGSRPNYAEDKDLDAEFESIPKANRAGKRSYAAVSEQPPISSGFAAINNTNSDPLLENVTGAGHSTPAPATVPAPSKKRKHPGSNHTIAAHSAIPASSRSRNTASMPFKGYVETNMMSFSRSGSRLNAKNQLIADDGTVVQANGESSRARCPPSSSPVLTFI